MTHYERFERRAVERFLWAGGIAEPQLSDPNSRGQETGADVVWTVDGRAIGFQVTEYHSDKGRDPTYKGSQLRREEMQKAARHGIVGTWGVPLDPIPAIVSAVTEKVSRANRPEVRRFRGRFSELILLIVSSIPQYGGTVATFLFDLALDLPRLNVETHELLSHSPYTSAYICNMLTVDGSPSIYEWTESGWTRRGVPPQPDDATEHVRLQTIRYLQSLGGPHPAPGSLSDGLDATFIPELLEAFPGDRDPTVEEITAFERSWRERHGPGGERRPTRRLQGQGNQQRGGASQGPRQHVPRHRRGLAPRLARRGDGDRGVRLGPAGV